MAFRICIESTKSKTLLDLICLFIVWLIGISSCSSHGLSFRLKHDYFLCLVAFNLNSLLSSHSSLLSWHHEERVYIENLLGLDSMKSHLSCLELAWPNSLAKNSLNYILVIFQLILVVWLYLNDIIEDKVVIVSRWPYSIKLNLVAVLSVLSNANLRSGVSSCWVLISFWLITCVEVGESRSWASLEKLNFVFIWLSQLLFQTVRTVNGLKIIIYLWLLLGWLPRVRVCIFLYT